MSIAWLTLLEISATQLTAKLKEAVKRLGLAKDVSSLTSALPIKDAVYMALDGKSPYWAERAVQRLSESGRGVTMQPRFVEPLKLITNSHSLSQRTRHQAVRLIREFAQASQDSDTDSPS
ncbi:hypothetical protein MF672_042750 [Actinomadura sp. ATCC 31491]|uniref:Uncharacterized protein n=1 Tax=Actinomadura luzonensis TaxID=2805427 RepID=A0ABT0G7A3_9ACTN|nr:hypothetical protein [Actinomadura luzonensis]MCK2220476.1 hypothetical protein [Actinomadura luzonensis]